MNVLFSQTYYRPYISGLTIYSARVAESLAESGCCVTALAIAHNPKLLGHETINGVNVVRTKMNWQIGKGAWSWMWFAEAIRQVFRNKVVVINIPQIEGVWLAMWAKILRRKVVVIYHCDAYFGRGWKIILGVLVQTTSWLTAFLANIVITSTKDYADSSFVLKRLINKTQYIYPLVILKPAKKNDITYLKKKIGSAGHLIIGMVGRWSTEKGIEYLLRALPVIKKSLGGKKIKLVFAGPTDTPGETNYATKIDAMVNDLSDSIIKLGHLSDSQLAGFYKVIDILVIPSVNRFESLGMVQLEAMMCGVPVVASDIPGVRIPIQITGMGKIVKAADVQSLARGIIDVLKEYQKYSRFKVLVNNIFKKEESQIKFINLICKQ
jgi:glycosyltransferase involved in cell wall biosynthesis